MQDTVQINDRFTIAKFAPRTCYPWWTRLRTDDRRFTLSEFDSGPSLCRLTNRTLMRMDRIMFLNHLAGCRWSSSLAATFLAPRASVPAW